MEKFKQNKIKYIGILIEAIAAAVLIYGNSGKVVTVAFLLFGIGMALIIIGIFIQDKKEKEEKNKSEKK